MARVGISCTLAGSALALSATGSAQAAALSNNKISGIDVAISCMTASRCVAVGDGAHHGQVVALTNGKQTRVSTVGAAEHLYSVSCPASAGCWAVGPQNTGANVVLVKIGSTGKVTKSIKVTVPAGASLTRIACVSMSSCELVGTNIFFTPFALEIASWNGKKLSVHRLAGLKGSTDATLEGVSCWRASCDAVGYYFHNVSKITGFILTISRGKAGKVHTANNDSFYGVSCVSSSKCYTAGFVSGAAGVVVTLTNGVAGHAQAESADVSGIECAGATCRASGLELGGALYYGVIVTLSNGVAKGSPVVDMAINGFDGPQTIAKRGDGFAAVGPQQKGTGSEVATG